MGARGRGERASQQKEGLRKGGVHSGGMKVGKEGGSHELALIPGGLGFQVDVSVLIPIGTGKTQNVLGLIRLERI